MIDRDLARALALQPTATRTDLARAMIRYGLPGDTYRYQPDDHIPPAVITFMSSLAEHMALWLWDNTPVSLNDQPPTITREALRDLQPHDAPAVLAAIAPDQIIPAGPAKDIGRACRALVNKHLEDFVGRILHGWIEIGMLRTTST